MAKFSLEKVRGKENEKSLGLLAYYISRSCATLSISEQGLIIVNRGDYGLII